MQNLANESNLFARFILQSDDNGNAGGWYIDDVSILQASQISGVITNWPGVDVVLYGENYNGSILDKKQTDGSGAFQFDLLPLGSYQVGTVGTSFGPFALTYDTNSISLGATNAPAVAFTAMFGTPRVITWNAVPGLTYRIQYAFNVFGPWFDLPNGLIVGSGPVETYYDYSGDASRMYRILLISSP